MTLQSAEWLWYSNRAAGCHVRFIQDILQMHLNILEAKSHLFKINKFNQSGKELVGWVCGFFAQNKD